MKKLIPLIIVLLAFTTSNASAISFSDVAIEKDTDGIERVVGTASAELDFSILDHTLTVTINNTSDTTFTYTGPTADFSDGGGTVTLINGTTYDQASALVAFGFNLSNDLTLLSSALTALEGDPLTSTGNLIGSDWTMGTFRAGITLDYLPQTDGDVKGALYNPAAVGSGALAALPNYFTTATLILKFDGTPQLDFSDQWSPFVRFQNVGAEGIGSIKAAPVPEPATMLLLGTGLIGLAGFGRKKFKIKELAYTF